MAKYGSDQVAFLMVNGKSLLGVTTQFTENREATLEDTTALGKSWVEQEHTGENRGDFSQEGFYDSDSALQNGIMAEQEGVEQVFCYGLEGNTRGKKFVGYLGQILAKWTRTAARGQLHKAKSEWKTNGEIEDGVLLTAGYQVDQSDGAQAAVDQISGSANGAAGFLQVGEVVLDGATSFTIKIQDSTDNISFDDLITFTNVTGPGAQRVEVAGTVNRYVRAEITANGGSSPTISLMVGMVRK